MMRRKCKVKTEEQDFPGSPVVKNPAVNTGDAGLIPGPGRSHMPQTNEACAPQLVSKHSRAHAPPLLSPRATAIEAQSPRARAPRQEKPKHCN